MEKREAREERGEGGWGCGTKGERAAKRGGIKRPDKARTGSEPSSQRPCRKPPRRTHAGQGGWRCGCGSDRNKKGRRKGNVSCFLWQKREPRFLFFTTGPRWCVPKVRRQPPGVAPHSEDGQAGGQLCRQRVTFGFACLCQGNEKQLHQQKHDHATRPPRRVKTVRLQTSTNTEPRTWAVSAVP